MHGDEKSDRPVVPASPPNKAAQAAAEAGEGSGLGKENAASATRPGHRAGWSVPSARDRVRRVATKDRGQSGSSTLARRAIPRPNPSQEPRELKLTLGSVRGAGRALKSEGPSLPRPRAWNLIPRVGV
jgi:hypothetical protein